MATSRAFAYNNGSAISGLTQIGNLSISETNLVGLTSSLVWYIGPDEELGYVIAYENAAGTTTVPDGRTASIQFWRSATQSKPSFLTLSNYISNRHGSPQNFIYATQAVSWLNSNGYWTSYSTAPYASLDLIAIYLRGYMSDFRNPSFYSYRLDGNGQYINDGGNDMYDFGNFTTPWLRSGIQYTSSISSTASYTQSAFYTNTTRVLTDTDFYYVSLGYTQFNNVNQTQDSTYLPLTVLGSRSNAGPIGWQVGGNSGADGAGSMTSSVLWNGTQSNGFTTYAFFRETYSAGDPSHCNLIILLGHPNWDSSFGTLNSFADPAINGGNGAYYYSTTASNILTIHTLLSKASGVLVTANECRDVVSNFTLRIKQSLSF
jgi:hypothetical protein